jgi:hypothetical protein
VALRTADWTQVLDLLKARTPQPELPHLDFLARQLAGFAAGMQAIESQDLSQAEDLSTRFDAELWRMSENLKHSPETQGIAENKSPAGPPKLQFRPHALLQPLMTTLSVMSLELRGSLLMARRDTTNAKPLFAQARKDEKALGYREPPGYIRPVGETETASLMLASDWARAEMAYEQALVERPRSGFPLYGIAMCSEKLGDSAAAAKQCATFLAAWRKADPDLAQITHAQAYLAEHPATKR